MFRNIIFFLIIFLFTYEEEVARNTWIFPYRIYSQISLLLLLGYFVIDAGLKRLLSFYISNTVLSFYVILLTLPLLFSVTNTKLSIDGLNMSILSLANLSLSAFLISERKTGGYEGILAMFSNTAVIISIVAITRVFIDLSFIGVELPALEIGRLNGWMRSANYFSMLVSVAFFIEFQVLFWRKQTRTISYFKIFLFLIVIILSGSRGTLITLGILIVINIFYSFWLYRGRNVLLQLGSLLLVISIFWSFSGYVTTAMGYSNEFFESEVLRTGDSFEDDPRAELWTNALDLVINRDLVNTMFGYGVNSSLILLGRSSHNSFITMALDYGIVYLLIFILISIRVLFISLTRGKSNITYLLVANIILFLVIRGITNNVVGSVGIMQILFNMSFLKAVSNEQ